MVWGAVDEKMPGAEGVWSSMMMMMVMMMAYTTLPSAILGASISALRRECRSRCALGWMWGRRDVSKFQLCSVHSACAMSALCQPEVSCFCPQSEIRFLGNSQDPCSRAIQKFFWKTRDTGLASRLPFCNTSQILPIRHHGEDDEAQGCAGSAKGGQP